MYRFIIKMISHSSTEQNVCTHTHPHGHARKCCQITLVHTHGHTRGATLVLTVQPGHAQAHLGTLYIRRARSSSRAAAQRAHGAFKCSTHMRRKRRHESCIASDGRRCRCCPQLPVPGGRSKHRSGRGSRSCAHGDQQRRPRRSIGHGELHLRAPTEHP